MKPNLNFDGLGRRVDYWDCAVDLGAFDFLEGVVNALFGRKKTEGKNYRTQNDYFINSLHIQYRRDKIINVTKMLKKFYWTSLDRDEFD